MLARVFTATMEGLKPHLIEVEVDTTPGIPNVQFIGLPSRSVDEAKERVLSSLINCGISIKSKRTLVNLAPADLRKTGNGLELAIAVSLLKLYGEITQSTDDMMFFGELSLDGSLKPVRGCLPLVMVAEQLGFRHVIIPQPNARKLP